MWTDAWAYKGEKNQKRNPPPFLIVAFSPPVCVSVDSCVWP